MGIRESFEEREKTYLSPYACLSSETRGRQHPLASRDDMRTDFQRDRDRIIHCKSFRRLMHKTQVFLSPEHDHYRTRLTHTLEVCQVSRAIARALLLNEDLCEAAALGHDLGHTPFGHSGEDAMRELYSPDFSHYAQSLRVVEKLENKAMSKKDQIEKYEFWGLMLFVGIPLPGTGAWTGSLIASMLNMPFKKAFPATILGILMAAVIMDIVSYGLLGLFI